MSRYRRAYLNVLWVMLGAAGVAVAGSAEPAAILLIVVSFAAIAFEIGD